MPFPTVEDCTLIELPKINNARGNLTFVEGTRHIPFAIKRVFYIYDVPTGEDRGAHSHREQHQFLVCLSGSFDVVLDDGRNRKVVHLNRQWKGLHIPPMIWAAETNFDAGTVCLVFASDFYSEPDYVRDYAEFMELSRG